MAGRVWRFYSTDAGRSPVREFLVDSSLPLADRDEILAALKDVQVNGMSVTRHIHGEIHEVRADGRRQAYRLLFAAEGPSGQVLLGLSAYTKSGQRTPITQIALAEHRLVDWRDRTGGR